jgi:sugar phosphate isomerase/epimerase
MPTNLGGIDRRRFLAAGAAALTAAGANPADAAPPEKLPRLFPGCCAYSYRKFLQHGPMTMEDFIRRAVTLRIDGVDMTGYYYKSREPAYLASLRNLAYRNGVAFSGAACGVSMVNADAAARKQALADIKEWVDATDRLGAPHLRVFAGKLPPGATAEQAIDWVVETMKPATDYSGGKGIMVGIEDHSGVTQHAEVCLEIMRRVDSPYAGINLDITHFLPEPGRDAYAQIEACIPYATNVHVRDVFDDGTPIDMDRIWRLFAGAGFAGFLSAEYEGKEDPMTGVPKLVDKIRTLCKRYSSV